jgi:hypothetical protein
MRLEDIRFWWPSIRDEVAQIQRASGDAVAPEEVYVEVREGRADFWRNDKGWAVTQFVTCPHTKQRTLFIWMLRSRGQLISAMRHFDELATRQGCSAIEMSTANQRLAALQKRFTEWAPVRTTLRKEL